MPEIAPGRFVRYSDGTRLTDVVSPPYDVIDEEARAALEQRSPHNYVRLILPREQPGEPPQVRYARARELLEQWIEEGALVQDDRPSLLVVEQRFTDLVTGEQRVRRGVQALLKLSEFSEGKVLPHERTLSGPKADRLSLMKAVGAHLSPIFVLYPDPANEVLATLAEIFQRAPDGEAEAAGATHRMWRVYDQALVSRVSALLADKVGFIADGHHRYETALAFRREAKAAGTSTENTPLDYIPAFLCGLSDPGLVVFPTHRLLHSTGLTVATLLPKLEGAFTVERLPRLDADALLERVRAAGEHAFAVLGANGEAAVLRWQRDTLSSLGLPAGPVGELDVSALHSVVFERLLGLSRESQERQENLRYVKDGHEAIRRTLAGEAELAFLLNATPTAQVRAVAEAGEVMPQKSTYFYPKIIDGLALQRLDDA